VNDAAMAPPALAPAALAPARQTRRELFLHGPIGATLFLLSWPNVLVNLAQASTGLVETWWLSFLGTDTLAGMAIVFPVVMLMQMMSGGAIGGGIASAIARATGGGRHAEAGALVLHALVINLALGVTFSALVLGFGPSLYRVLGGDGAALDVALAYSNVVFAGVVLLWVMNGLASVIRGTGNMLVPALAICGGVLVLIPLSPLLIFGIGPFPRLGVAGGGVALLLYYLGATLFFAWYILSGRNPARFRWVPLQWRLFREILRVGGLAALTSLQTNLTIAITTALVGRWFGPAEIAGFGTAARLEYLMMPLVFGIGSSLVAMVGMNIGAGQERRALRIAFTGGIVAFLITEAIGIAAALWPEAWLRLFDSDPSMLAAGATYLRIVGPFYGFYGLGFALYFACQGAGRLLWPLLAGLFRLIIAAIGGWLMLGMTGAEGWLYAALALGLVVYGTVITLTTANWRLRRGFQAQHGAATG
jgi:putative MATE family efflux protein